MSEQPAKRTREGVPKQTDLKIQYLTELRYISSIAKDIDERTSYKERIERTCSSIEKDLEV